MSVRVEVFAPVPDFRYVGLEPIPVRKLGFAATAFGLGAGVTMAMSGLGAKAALAAGAVASFASGLALHRASGGSASLPSGSARMGIVPWGVLVDAEEAPRILRWAGVRKVDVITSRVGSVLAGAALSSRVVVETEHDRFVGEALGMVPLERLVVHLDAYALEQASPIAIGLDAEEGAALETHEPCCEALLDGARGFLESGRATARLDLPPGGYRGPSAHAASARAVEVLGRVLRDRTPRAADPRAFAAILAAEVHAVDVAPDLVALTQCPHPIVAAVAKQAARRLGVARSRTGALDEVAPFLHDRDRARLDAWARS